MLDEVENSMGLVVALVENINPEKFKDEMEVTLRDFAKQGISTDVKFSTCKIGDGDQFSDGILYTAMIIASKNS